MAPFLDDLKRKFEHLRPADAAQTKACSEEQVVALEQQLSVKLPLAYREYLFWMGCRGSFLNSTYCHLQDLPTIKQWAREILAQSRPQASLPEDAFVFALDQSETIYFFRTSEGSDPKVYLLIEPELELLIRRSPKASFSSAWGFLFDGRGRADFYEFFPSFSQFLNYQLEQFTTLKGKTEAWRANYKAAQHGAGEAPKSENPD